MEFSSVINDILKGKEAEKQKPTAYDTTAEVLRIDGDTAWVHMAGGIDETPVKLTIDAKPGDTVQVRVGGGRAWLTGNFTAPPTDDTSALEAKILAKIADDQAKTVVKRADDGEFDGADGFSPIATVTKSGDIATIEITDINGTTIETISDGTDGHTPTITTSKSGNTTTIYADGVAVGTVDDGVDGSTPTITATKSGGVTTIKANGTAIATVNDGTSISVTSATKSGGTTTVVLSDGTILTIDDGADGNNGANGLNGYVHIAWANSADGATDFSTSVSTGKTYLGSYTDNTQTDSQTPSDYNWSLIQGAKGDNGIEVKTGTSGSVVHITDASAYPALELVADIIPIQPNDYDSVWVGGGGKNVCVPFEGTKYGIVRTVNDDGTVSITGTATATSWAYLEEYYDLPYCGIDVGDTISIYSDVYIAVMAYNGTTSLGSKSSKDGVATTYTIPANTTRIRILQYPKSTTPASGETFDTTARYWVSKSAFSSWEPYENICPIYGHDHCDVVVSPTLLDTDGTTYTTNFPQIVYGGTLDVVKGILTVTYDNIASYNGETLNGEWISDRDIYVSGTTPTTGAQVVYELDTPIVYKVSPMDIELITGTCNVWATTGDITDFKYAEISSDTLMVLDKVNADIKQTSQYFWHEQTGEEAGAHITEIPQEEFEANPSGGNLLATSNGIVVRDGLSDTAVYSADGIILYAPNNVLGFQIATTGGTSEQSVLRVRNVYYPSGTITDTIPQLSSIPESTEIEWRWASTRMSLDRTLTFTRGTSATETVSFTLTQTATVLYDGVATFTITNNSGIEDFRNVSVRYEYVTTTPEIKVKDAVLTDGTWYCESKVLLWTNSDPSSDWSGNLTSSDIDLNILALCDEVEIYYFFSTSDRFVYSQRCNVYHGGAQSGYKTRLSIVNLSSNRCGGRDVTLVSDTSGFTINSGFYNGSQNNAYAIPWKIVGIRHI